nr:orf124 [Ipomoea batatas]
MAQDDSTYRGRNGIGFDSPPATCPLDPSTLSYQWKQASPLCWLGEEFHFHRERFNPATGSPTATLLRLHPSRRPHRGETNSQGVTGGVYRARHVCGPAHKGHADLTSSPPSSSISLAVLNSPPTCPLRPVIPKNTCPPVLPRLLARS